MPRLGLTAIVASCLVIALSACGPTITAPDVVGMRLDAAHREFEKLGVEEFDDVDGVEDRSIMWDSNWVVIAQDPAAGTADVDTGTKIKLTVANEDDDELLDLIPADSPEAKARKKQREQAEAKAEEKAAKKEAEEAAEKEKKEKEEADAKAKAKAAQKKYAETIDPIARVGRDTIVEIAEFIEEAEASMSDTDLTLNVEASTQALDLYVASLGLVDAPSGLKSPVGGLKESLSDFKRVPLTLLSANGSDRKGAISRARSIYVEALKKYNDALNQIYGDSGPEPPKLSLG